MKYGFLHTAAVSPALHVADCAYNTQQIIAAMRAQAVAGTKLLCLPELTLTGYTCSDLFLQETLCRGAEDGLIQILDASKELDLVALVGLPVRHNGKLYNCAAVVCKGQLLGLVPKTYLPNGNEFYETRWFASGAGVHETVSRDGLTFPLSADTLFEMGGFVFGVELCEDLWVPLPPSSHLAVEGADLILNPSASNALAAKHAYRRGLLSQQSGRLYAGYAYAGAGFGESTSDMVFDGYTGVFENGRALSEGERFSMSGSLAVADVDIGRLRYQRQRNGSFHQMPRMTRDIQRLTLGPAHDAPLPLMRPLEPLPFVPFGAEAGERLEEIAGIQCMGLETRLHAVHGRTVVVGVSGGLDSTLGAAGGGARV